MVFSSIEFIYLFLPPVLLVYLVLRALKWEQGIILWLILASLGFYAWWSPVHLILLIGSVIFNYTLHHYILKHKSKAVLTLGIVANLATLAYFKYADFLIANVAAISGLNLPMLNIILPLAISFFTFQQISFLYDTYIGRIHHCDFSRYCLFVVFFPQLIAGPIVLQKHTIPQFHLSNFQKQLFLNLSIGATLFIIGLFKKIVIADGMAPLVNQVFGLAEAGHSVPMQAAWIGTFAYTFQIYFDFSGYCDMALGLARLFGIKLPINFNSPYKALNIVDFWRRWHITLSAFLRDYLYIPLGGNKKGKLRRYINLMATMILGGLWHGASWNFVFWGFLHGFYLTVNHAWGFVPKRDFGIPAPILRFFAHAITMVAVMVAWVFFRALNFEGAGNILIGMFGLTQAYDPNLWAQTITDTGYIWLSIIGLSAFVVWLPNSIELTQKYRPVLHVRNAVREAWGIAAYFKEAFSWRPSRGWAAVFFIIGTLSLIQIYRLQGLTEFIYFNF